MSFTSCLTPLIIISLPPVAVALARRYSYRFWRLRLAPIIIGVWIITLIPACSIMLQETAVSLNAYNTAQSSNHYSLSTSIHPDGFGPIYKTAIITQGIHGTEYGHYAIDIAAGRNATIYSPISGIVTQRFTDEYRNPNLAIANDQYEVTFLHGDYSVTLGQQIATGQPIGTESNQGYTMDANGNLCNGRNGCGDHTHISVKDSSGRGVDARTLGLTGNISQSIDTANIPILITWYDPILGGINCADPCNQFADGSTINASSYYGAAPITAAACIREWLGRTITITGLGTFRCHDTGGAIKQTYNATYKREVIYVDILAHAPNGVDCNYCLYESWSLK